MQRKHLLSVPGLLLLLWFALHSAPFYRRYLRWSARWMRFALVVRSLCGSNERWGLLGLASSSLLMRIFFLYHRLTGNELVGLVCGVSLAWLLTPVWTILIACIALFLPGSQASERGYLLWMELVYLTAGAAWLLVERFKILKKGSAPT